MAEGQKDSQYSGRRSCHTARTAEVRMRQKSVGARDHVIDRRGFLRTSGAAAGGVLGFAAASPALPFAGEPQRGGGRGRGAAAERPGSSSRTISRQFAQWIVGLRYED